MSIEITEADRAQALIEQARTIASQNITGWPWGSSYSGLRADIERSLIAALQAREEAGRPCSDPDCTLTGPHRYCLRTLGATSLAREDVGESAEPVREVSPDMLAAYVAWDPPCEVDVSKPARALGLIRAAFFAGWQASLAHSKEGSNLNE